ncbi:MAG: FAD-dependent oxidoreductase [Planctomyces sp.]|nr:FAD-dependent oxidoreductase [Planctomyces sp.]
MTSEFLDLPPHLAERCRFFLSSACGRLETLRTLESPGSFLLYWMRTAIRVDENPALDVARHVAHQKNVPLLVYQALSESYPYASDRHHVFILQGARDVQVAFDEMGISYAFHLERPGVEDDYLRQLANAACAVITEEMPVPPSLDFLKCVAEQSSTPFLCVDTACVVPMQLVGRAFDRAFEYRRRTRTLYASRVHHHWLDNAPMPDQYRLENLPFRPVNLVHEDLGSLVAACRIDHSVGPVTDTTGGSKAGYERWTQYRDQRLRYYAATRNNPLVTNGVSRMSAYLHYGMVSPFRIAREAADFKHEGAEKYLDELLIWRELAYSFCFYTERPHDWNALPEWARRTLEAHQSDARVADFSWEQMARGETGDRLWDAAQKSLLIHGELHNNVRMTWGKAFLEWTNTPQRAMQMAFDLNDRYALDGRDPASVGGILWCFGQFDRPFFPESEIYGTVRLRRTADHAKRLDVERYGKHTTVSRASRKPRIAVIGCGVSGASAARVLTDHGLDVTVMERGRGPSGRSATRRTDLFHFDHGAPCFTVRSRQLRRDVRSWSQQGLTARWEGRFCTLEGGDLSSGAVVPETGRVRYVGVPGMSALGRHLASSLNVLFETEIASLHSETTGVLLLDDQNRECGEFDHVILAMPAPQSARLVPESLPLRKVLESITYESVWALMLTLPQRLTVDWNGLTCSAGPIRRVSREQTKPGRLQAGGDRNSQDVQEHLVIHSSATWASERLNETPEQVAQLLFRELEILMSRSLAEPLHVQSHRWRFALPQFAYSVQSGAGPQSAFKPIQPFPATQVIASVDDESRILACGDFLGTHSVSGVESAYLSGIAAAGCILRNLRT